MSCHDISNGTIEYIERNLCEDISLDVISKKMNYSKSHFHRLFLADMGISVSDYVRKRRVRRTASALLVSKQSISTIAHDYGFNNIDTYIRCFKRYYGITPSEYRKLQFRSLKQNIKECITIMNLEYDIRNCSTEDKQNAIVSLERIIELSKMAHQSGLLSLENAINDTESIFLRKGIELLLYGTEPYRLRRILNNYIATTELNDYELLVRIVFLEGILLIQEGAYPWDIRTELLSYFGEEFIDAFNNPYNGKDNLERYINQNQFNLKVSSLDNELKKTNKRSMQRLLRDCDIVTTAIAFKGTSNNVRRLVIESLPEGRQCVLSEVLELIDNSSMAQVIDAQNEIINTIKELRLSNDIQ